MSSPPSHYRRPQLERTAPNRSEFGAARPSGTLPGATQGFVAGANEAVCDLVENGVRTAYAVIDEYMRRGQNMARGLFDSNRGGYMNDCRGSYSGGYGGAGYPPPAGYGVWNPMVSMAEQWIAALRAWNYFLCGFVPMAQPWQPQSATNQYGAVQPRQENVSVRISSRIPVECTASLPNLCPPQDLSCDPLEYLGQPGAKPITSVKIDSQPGSVLVNVAVPDDQAPGCYRGSIRRELDKYQVGSLTVIVRAEQPVSR